MNSAVVGFLCTHTKVVPCFDDDTGNVFFEKKLCGAFSKTKEQSYLHHVKCDIQHPQDRHGVNAEVGPLAEVPSKCRLKEIDECFETIRSSIENLK